MPMKLPISLYHEIVLATKNTFSSTSLVKTFQDNLSQEGANNYILNDPSPSHLGMHDDALIPIWGIELWICVVGCGQSCGRFSRIA